MNIFLKLGSVQDKPVWGGKQLYWGFYIQEWAHLGILILALILVPLMLFVKPCKEHNKILKDSREINLNQEEHLLNKQGHDHKEHSFGEIFIHQVIETIEFVLGAVSNTASYLRLWALSLAHGQLSKVFFQKTIMNGIEQENVIIGTVMIFLGYIVFASVTFCVLMCMDMMECFLHTLRLHW
jgi:V-type H+-transporting ATPase subunit a